MATITTGYLHHGSGQPLDTTYTLDRQGRTLRLDRPDGALVQWQRDPYHNVVFFMDERMNISWHEYYDEGQGGLLESVQAPDQGTTRFEYHPLWKTVSKITDARGNCQPRQ